MMQKGRLNIIIDGQFGSTGKGKVAGYLALRDDPDASVCSFSTNAGHWFRSKQHGDFLVQQLPSAAVNPDVKLFISAGAGITMSTFNKEVAQFENAGIKIWDRLTIDPHAVIIEPHHAEEEQMQLGRISSTLKGCGAAYAAKTLRRPDVVLARDIREWDGIVAPVAPRLHQMLESGATILGESAQGFDLSINHGHTYPYVTSRDVTPMTFLSECGVPPKWLGDVYGVIRTYPIRVGHYKTDTFIGNSGPHYDDQRELTWDEMSVLIGKPTLEKTTVTGRVRRVFTFSMNQYVKFLRYCDPNKIVLNFCNYFPGVDENTKSDEIIGHIDLLEMIDRLEDIGPRIVMLGTGADNAAMIDVEEIGVPAYEE